MGFVCVGISKLPCYRGKQAKPAGAPPSPKKVPHHKLVPAGDVAEDSQHFAADVPAAAVLGYRQPAYYRHAIRAADNRLQDAFEAFEAPSLFSIDPEASVRARGRWRAAALRGSSSVFPTDPSLTQEEREEKSVKAVLSFMTKSASSKKAIRATPADPERATGAGAVEPEAAEAAAIASADAVDPIEPFVAEATSEAPVPAAATSTEL